MPANGRWDLIRRLKVKSKECGNADNTTSTAGTCEDYVRSPIDWRAGFQ